MIDPNKRLPATFFRADNGSEPVRDWLQSLERSERIEIGAAIRKVEFTWPVGMPTCRPLGNGLFEVRANLTRTRRIARVIFYIQESYMVLLHGFIKKSQKTPQKDLSLALERKRISEATNDN